jgi:FMN phosphatase YigB (HAD superfamily)
MKLSDFKLLTFDTYGTLIDWESGIYNALEPLLDKVPIKLGRDEVLELFAEFEMQQQAATPSLVYSSLLAEVARSIAHKWQIKISDQEAFDFGRSVKHWPAFDDSAEALNYLRRHWQQRAARDRVGRDLHGTGYRLLQAEPAQLRVHVRARPP